MEEYARPPFLPVLLTVTVMTATAAHRTPAQMVSVFTRSVQPVINAPKDFVTPRGFAFLNQPASQMLTARTKMDALMTSVSRAHASMKICRKVSHAKAAHNSATVMATVSNASKT